MDADVPRSRPPTGRTELLRTSYATRTPAHWQATVVTCDEEEAERRFGPYSFFVTPRAVPLPDGRLGRRKCVFVTPTDTLPDA